MPFPRALVYTNVNVVLCWLKNQDWPAKTTIYHTLQRNTLRTHLGTFSYINLMGDDILVLIPFTYDSTLEARYVQD